VEDFVPPPWLRPEQPRPRTPTVLLINKQISYEARDVRNKLPLNLFTVTGPGDHLRWHHYTILWDYISKSALQSVRVVRIHHLGEGGVPGRYGFKMRLIGYPFSVWEGKHALEHVILRMPKGSYVFDRASQDCYDSVSYPLCATSWLCGTVLSSRRSCGFASSYDSPSRMQLQQTKPNRSLTTQTTTGERS